MTIFRPFAFLLPCILTILAQTPDEAPDPDCGKVFEIEPHTSLCADGTLFINVTGQVVDGLTRPVSGAKVSPPSSTWEAAGSSSVLTDASGGFATKMVLAWYDRLQNDTDLTQQARIMPYTNPFTIKVSKPGYKDQKYTFCAPRNATEEDGSGTINVGALRIFKD